MPCIFKAACAAGVPLETMQTLETAMGDWQPERPYRTDGVAVRGFTFGDEGRIPAFPISGTSDKTISSIEASSSPALTPSEEQPPPPRMHECLVGNGRVEQQLASYPDDFQNLAQAEDVNGAGVRESADIPETMDIDRTSRSPSPAIDDSLEQDRTSLWSNDARVAFHEMVTAGDYVNRYRMHMKKKQRMVHYLEHPDIEPMLCDGSKDHQTKYQATNWMWQDGVFYRKPEAGRVGTLRRHLDEIEAWDAITREHVRSGHLGRDKLRKRLECRYIGYTLQEIMFVLKECKKCSGRETSTNISVEHLGKNVTSQTRPQQGQYDSLYADYARVTSTGPFQRLQTSNAMFP